MDLSQRAKLTNVLYAVLEHERERRGIEFETCIYIYLLMMYFLNLVYVPSHVIFKVFSENTIKKHVDAL